MMENDLITSKDLMLRDDIKDSCRVATAHIRSIGSDALQAEESKTIALAISAVKLIQEALDDLKQDLMIMKIKTPEKHD